MDTTIEDLAWMTGAWRCEIWDGTFEEFWTPPSGEIMQGCGRHTTDGKNGFMEFMSIEKGPGGLTMYMILGAPSNGDKKPVPFKLTSFIGNTALFENSKNDYPSKIAYVREEDGMSCWIEGVQNGQNTKEDFRFRKFGG